MSEITNAEAISQWSNAPHEVIENFGDEGDFARQYLLNPAIFALLGDVTSKKILDAGCGEGYLCRLLAKKGAIEPQLSQEIAQRFQYERDAHVPSYIVISAMKA